MTVEHCNVEDVNVKAFYSKELDIYFKNDNCENGKLILIVEEKSGKSK